MSSQISTICILLVTTSLPQKNTLLNVIAKLPEIAVGTSVLIERYPGEYLRRSRNDPVQDHYFNLYLDEKRKSRIVGGYFRGVLLDFEPCLFFVYSML
jgi:hypothetical protein